MEKHYKLLEDVVGKLTFIPTKDMIVKPLEDEYVEKEVIKPVETGEKDENGYPITDSETVKEKVLTTFKKGIVLRLPKGYQWQEGGSIPEVGDVVVYPRKSCIDFDLFKDSQLINPYNVVALIRGEQYFKDEE